MDITLFQINSVRFTIFDNYFLIFLYDIRNIRTFSKLKLNPSFQKPAKSHNQNFSGIKLKSLTCLV